MLNISTAHKNTYIQSEHLHKDILIEVFYSGITWRSSDTPWSDQDIRRTLENGDVISESLELEQHLCDGEVDYVGVVASTCKFTLAKNWIFRLGSGVRIKIVTDGFPAQPITIFTGYISEYSQNFTDGEVEYTCYDYFGMEYFQEWKFGDVLADSDQSWTIRTILNEMNGHRSLRIRNYDNLCNINLSLSKNDIEVFRGMSASDVLKYICQINGIFGIIDNEGYLIFRKINPNGNLTGTYPSQDTIPSAELYPGVHNAGGSNEYILLPYESYESDLKWLEEKPVNGVLIMETERNDIDKTEDRRQDVKNYSDIGFQGSVIKIVGNPFVHNKSSNQKLTVANNIQNNAGGYSYYEYQALTKGLPFIEVGDYVDFIVTDWNELPENRHRRISCLITNRVLKGLQHMTDDYSAKALDPWKDTSSVNYIMALSPCTNVEESMKTEDEYTNVDEKIDEKIDEAGNLWKVKSVMTLPESPEPKTIYLVRGIVMMHGFSESSGDNYDYDG